MNTISIPFHSRVFYFHFPEKFSELKAGQLRRLVPLLPRITRAYELTQQKENLALAHEADAELQKLRGQALLILVELRPWQLLRRIVLFSLYADEWEALLRCTNFLVTTEEHDFELPLKIKIKGRPLAGPGRYLRYLTGDEFHFAADRYQKLREHRSDGTSASALERQNLVNELLYCLCRPEDPKYSHPASPALRDDTREDFNRFGLEKRARLMSRLAPADRQMIIWYYSVQMQMITRAYPRIFKKNQAKADRHGWLPVFRMLSKGISDQDSIAQKRMGRLLYELDQSILENQRLLKAKK